MKSTLVLLEESWNIIKTQYKKLIPIALVVAAVINLANTALGTDGILQKLDANISLKTIAWMLPILILIQLYLLFGRTTILQILLDPTHKFKTLTTKVGKKFGHVVLVAILEALALIPFIALAIGLSMSEVNSQAMGAVGTTTPGIWSRFPSDFKVLSIFIPIIAALIIGMYFLAAPLLILDKNLTAVQAIKQNFKLLKNRFIAATAAYVGPLVLWTIVLALFGFVAATLFSILTALLFKVVSFSITNTATLGLVTEYIGSTLFETAFLMVSSSVIYVWYKNLTE